MKRLLVPALLAASAVGLCVASAARAEVLTLAPVADTFIRSDQPSASQADNPLLLVGDTGAPGAGLRAVLGFDLAASTLPAGAVVRSVSLRLVSGGLDADSFDAEDTLELHALPDSFATNATWTARAGRERWRTPGALGGATPLATAKANAGLLRPG